MRAPFKACSIASNFSFALDSSKWHSEGRMLISACRDKYDGGDDHHEGGYENGSWCVDDENKCNENIMARECQE